MLTNPLLEMIAYFRGTAVELLVMSEFVPKLAQQPAATELKIKVGS
jgi:hypothetical protein